jgi:RNA polymerase sigma-70 factor, ECF subfamily
MRRILFDRQIRHHRRGRGNGNGAARPRAFTDPMTMTNIEDGGTKALQDSVDQTRKQFLAAVNEIRPRLHRFCSRMVGSPLDGEDLVQETLAQAFYSLSGLRDGTRFEPWLFRIAHNRCIDFLRRPDRLRTDAVSLEEEHMPNDAPDAPNDIDAPIDDALLAIVTQLPPMERSCVLLKDVLDYSLTDSATVVNSTVGGVKAALHRGRTKLRSARPNRLQTPPSLDKHRRRLLTEYIECFNTRDWDALRRLIEVDARVEVVGSHEAAASSYTSRYANLPWEWRMSLAAVGDEIAIVQWRRGAAADSWAPVAAIRLWWENDKVVRIRDYTHSSYIFTDVDVAEIPGA